MVKYIYSFYFTTTTILTVGYGDISPKNPAEVVVITFVEIFGTLRDIQGSSYLATFSMKSATASLLSRKTDKSSTRT